MTDSTENTAPPDFTFFNPNLGTVGDDGVLKVPMGGSGPKGMWDGVLTLNPDHEDYAFWTWMLKKWPYSSSLSAEDLPLLKNEFQQVHRR